jgi:hypothetical protein
MASKGIPTGLGDFVCDPFRFLAERRVEKSLSIGESHLHHLP